MDFSKVTKFLESLKNVGVPGADLAICIKGEEVYRHQVGYADLDTQKPILPDTLFAIWSMTKVITCVSALRLFEEGIFKLSDPLSDYLPEFKEMEVRHVKDNGEVHIKPAVNPIRVVDLFTMSSGLTYNETDSAKKLNEKTGGNHTLKEFVSTLAKDPLYFNPGTQWHYGFSHDVLGHLVEVLSGKSLGEYFVSDITPFYNNPEWVIDRFGKPLIIQMPEAMRYPTGGGHFNYMMIYPDGSRLALTFQPKKHSNRKQGLRFLPS